MGSIIKRAVYLICLLMFSFMSAELKGANATIAGTVTDSVTTNPIAGALVEAIRGNSVAYSTVTGVDGTYLMTGIEPSNYTLVASASGYQTESVGVKPKNNQTLIVDFALVPIGGSISGTVTDGVTSAPLVGSTIGVFSGEQLIQQATTGVGGFYTGPFQPRSATN